MHGSRGFLAKSKDTFIFNSADNLSFNFRQMKPEEFAEYDAYLKEKMMEEDDNFYDEFDDAWNSPVELPPCVQVCVLNANPEPPVPLPVPPPLVNDKSPMEFPTVLLRYLWGMVA